MRLFNQSKCKRRRGLSFVEIVSSLVVIALMGGAVIATVAVLTQNSRETAMYTKMKVEMVNLIETIQSDLERGYDGGADPIDSIDYNDNTGERTDSSPTCQLWISAMSLESLSTELKSR